jgi:deazaflavin-dependent oxidoreductase (nitroreductase family)
MAELNDANLYVIEEFRANEGKVGGFLKGAPVLLLTTTGAKSGKYYTTPLMYSLEGDSLVVFAANAGAPTNPDWYYNLKANPKAIVEVGTETFDVTANILTGEERDQLYAKQATIFPNFAQFEAMTTRKIPVIALKRQAN